MAHGNFPSGSCPDSDHIAAERGRLRAASVKHFAQGGGGRGQQFKEPIPQAPRKGPPSPGPMPQAPGGTDVEDEM